MSGSPKKLNWEAFEAACKDLDEAGQSSVIYVAVAKRIIEIAKSGERDPNQLRAVALGQYPENGTRRKFAKATNPRATRDGCLTTDEAWKFRRTLISLPSLSGADPNLSARLSKRHGPSLRD